MREQATPTERIATVHESRPFPRLGSTSHRPRRVRCMVTADAHVGVIAEPPASGVRCGVAYSWTRPSKSIASRSTLLTSFAGPDARVRHSCRSMPRAGDGRGDQRAFTADSRENSSDRTNAQQRGNERLEISHDRAGAGAEHEEDRCSIWLYRKTRAGRRRTRL